MYDGFILQAGRAVPKKLQGVPTGSRRSRTFAATDFEIGCRDRSTSTNRQTKHARILCVVIPIFCWSNLIRCVSVVPLEIGRTAATAHPVHRWELVRIQRTRLARRFRARP
jgi:hypothetical protein